MKTLGIFIACLLGTSAFASESFVCTGADSNFQVVVTLADAGVSAALSVDGVAAQPIAELCNIQGSEIFCSAQLNGSRFEIYPSVIGTRVMKVGVIAWQNGDVTGHSLNTCRAAR